MLWTTLVYVVDYISICCGLPVICCGYMLWTTVVYIVDHIVYVVELLDIGRG